MNRIPSVLRNAQARSLSQPPFELKRSFKMRRHKYRKHGRLMKGNLCFISNKMEIKTENGESETTEARWKGQI